MQLALLLPDPIHIGVDNSHVSRKSIVAGESLFLSTEVASDFLLARVVNRVLVASKVVWPREDGIAGLPC